MLIVDYKLGVMEEIYLNSLIFGEINRVDSSKKKVVGELKDLIDLLNSFGFTTNITGFLSKKDEKKVKEYFNNHNYFNPVIIKDEENLNINLDIQGVETSIIKKNRIREEEKKDLVNLYYSLLNNIENCYFYFKEESEFNELQMKLLTLAVEGDKDIYILEESGYLLKKDKINCQVLHTDLETIKKSYNISLTKDKDIKIIIKGLIERGIETIIISGRTNLYISDGETFFKIDNEENFNKMIFIPGILIGKTRNYDSIERIKIAFEIYRLYNEGNLKEIDTFADLDENIENINLIEF